MLIVSRKGLQWIIVGEGQVPPTSTSGFPFKRDGWSKRKPPAAG